MKRLPLSLLLCLLLCTITLQAQNIQRVEPLSWWAEMKTPLTVMFYGEQLQGAQVSVLQDGLRVKAVRNAESPNYLFVDVEVQKAGTYTFQLRKGNKTLKYKYVIHQRREESALRQSFTSADVLYLLMPDRFANGDPTNDTHRQTHEKSARNELFGRHGGDIQGIIDHLDYISDLGATAIWSTPLLEDNQPEHSYHGYACTDYYHIDPRYGTNEQYQTMVDQAHQRGLKVIMDIVTNHCGSAHWWMKDLPFKDWIHQFPEMTYSVHVFSANYDPNRSKHDLEIQESGWFDKSMPDMNLDNLELLQYFKQWAIWWVEYANLDGLRVDTYPYNEKERIAEWTKAIVHEYPNINIVGECWTRPASQVAYWEGGANNPDGYNSNLPSVMDFPLQENLIQALNEDGKGWNQGLTRLYTTIADDYLYQNPQKLLVFTGNHDIERIADQVGKNPQKVKLALTLLATVRGIPQLLYGDEMFLMSTDRSMGHGGLRVDFPGAWEGDSINLFDPAQRNADQAEVYNHYRKMLNWRKNEPIIHHGKTMHFLSRNNTYGYFRYTAEGAIFVFMNASDVAVAVPWENYTELTDKYHNVGEEIISGTMINNKKPTEVAPLSAVVVKFKNTQMKK